MPRAKSRLREDAERIWRAGVAAVSAERLIESNVHLDGDWLTIDEELIDMRPVGKIAIVGGGKAAGAMAAALESVLGPRLLREKNVAGWVNVPADCVSSAVVPAPLRKGQGRESGDARVHIHPGRPAGVNEPRQEGVTGTRAILDLVSTLGPADLCVCVLTGGGSALLPSPVPSITLDDKIRVTRLLSAAGAHIEQLNTVRRALSSFKGGGLARACRAGRLIALIISDVLGDALEAIASGPTAPNPTTRTDALAVLHQFDLASDPTIASIVGYLTNESRTSSSTERPRDLCRVTNLILGNNATAVDEAGIEAERLGYSHAMLSANAPEESAEVVGRHLAEVAIRMRDRPGPDCLISGGETTVALIEEAHRGQGGRNQQLALAALTHLGDCRGIALLSAGTDGEDGPTDAAGAFLTEEIAKRAKNKRLDASDYLSRNDAYRFFEQSGGLFITGPTQTNVCDLRVITVDRS